MNLQQKNIFKVILYFGLLFLFLALAIVFGVIAHHFHWYYGARRTSFVFFDIFAILFSIYWIIKIIFCLEIDKNNININQFKVIIYFGLFFLFFGLAILFGIYTKEINDLMFNSVGISSWINSLYIAFIFIDIFTIFLSIYWIIKSILCLYNNETPLKLVQTTAHIQLETDASIYEKQIDQIKTIASTISLYRKKGLNFAEIFTKVEAYNKGFKNEKDFKKRYLDFVNKEAITNQKWESVLEFELENQE